MQTVKKSKNYAQKKKGVLALTRFLIEKINLAEGVYNLIISKIGRKIISLILIITLCFCNYQVLANVTDGVVDADITVAVGNQSILLGSSSSVNVTIQNNDPTNWLYNVNLELWLDNGLQLQLPVDPSPISQESLTVAGAVKQKIVWNDITDLAPGQSFVFAIPLKVLDYYQVDIDHPAALESTGFNQIGATVASSASRSPYYFDEIYNQDTFSVSVLPVSVTATSPGKQLKGAGEDATAADNFNTFPYVITIKNNQQFSSVIDLSHLVPNGAEITNLTSGFNSGSGTILAQTEDYYQAASGDSALTWSLQLDPDAEFQISYDSAIFENLTDNSVVNTGVRISDGTNLTYRTSYQGSTDKNGIAIPINLVNLDRNAVAKDYILTKTKSLISGSPLGYGSVLEYSLQVRAAQYHDLIDLNILDEMGDGLDFLEAQAVYGGADYAITAVASNVTAYSHTGSPGSEVLNWTLDSLLKEASAVLQFRAEVMTQWTRGALAGVPIYANDKLINTSSSDTVTLVGSYPAQETNATASAVINKPLITKEIISVNGAGIAADARGFYPLKVGDEIRLRLTYDASQVNTKQKEVKLYDFYPFETGYATGVPLYYLENVVFKDGGTIVTPVLETAVVNGTNYQFAAGSVWFGASGNQAYFGNGNTDKLFSVEFPEVERNTVLSVEYVLRVNDSLKVINGKENYSMAKASFLNTSNAIDSQRGQLPFIYQAPVLSMTKSILTSMIPPYTTVQSASDLAAGDTLTFAIEVTNDGDASAYNVKLADTFDSELTNLTYLIGPAGAVATQAGNVLNFTVPEITAHSSATIIYTAQVSAAVGATRTFNNSADLVSYQKTNGGPDYLDQAVNKETSLLAKSPTLTKSVTDTEANPVRVNDWVVYQIQFSLPAGTNLYAAELIEVLPAGQSLLGVYANYDLASHTASFPVAFGSSGSKVTIAVGDYSAASYTVYVKTHVDTAVGVSSSQSNQAELHWNDKSAGSSSHQLTVTSALNVSKPQLAGTWNTTNFSIVQGQTQNLVYTIRNSGANTAYGFVPSITIPAGLTPSNWSVVPIGSVVVGTDVVYSFPEVASLAVNATSAISFTLAVDANRPAGQSIVLTGKTGNYYTTPAKVSFETSVSTNTTLKIPDVVVSKTVVSTSNGSSLTEIRPGDTVTYTIRVTVKQGTDAYDLELKDTLPAQFSLNSFSGGFVAGGVYNLIGDVSAVGSDVVYEYTVVAQAKTDGAYGAGTTFSARNTAGIRWDYSAGSDENIVKSVNRDISVKQPQMTIQSFTAVKKTFNSVSEVLNFQAELKNTGASEANMVKVKATIPSGMSVELYAPGAVVTGTTNTSKTIEWIFSAIEYNTSQYLSFSLKEDGDLSTPSNGVVTLSIEEYYSTENITSKKYSPVTANMTLNQPPVATGSVVSTPEDTTILGLITVADIDLPANTMTYSVQTGASAAQGSFTVDSNSGAWRFVPAHDFNGGPITVTVLVNDNQGGTAVATVQITVTPVNDPPVVPNYAKVIPEDSTLSSAVVATDVDGDSLTYSQYSNPSHGSVTLQADGNYLYIPTAYYNGPDSFQVKVEDGHGGIAYSTVNISISSVNNPPTVPSYVVQTLEETAVGGKVVGSDVDSALLSYLKSTNPSHGTVTVDAAGNWLYTPNLNYHGMDSFKVQVSDGTGFAESTVTIVVIPVNDPPTVGDYTFTIAEDNSVANKVVAADVDLDTLAYSVNTAPDPSQGSFVLNPVTGDWTFTPTANYNGPVTIKVNVSDGHGGMAVSTISITVTPVNDAPTVIDANRVTQEDTALDFSLVWFDNLYTDIEDANLVSVRIESLPAHGSLTLSGMAVSLNQVIPAAQLNGLKYTPSLNYHGDDLFTWKGFDGAAYSNLAKVDISIIAVNDNPVVPNYNVSTNEDTAVIGTIVATDVDGDLLSYALDTAPSHGTLSLNANDGSWSYTPAANYHGPDLFTVLAHDGNGGSALSTVNLTVNPINDPPTIPDYVKTMDEDAVLHAAVLGQDIDGDSLSYSKRSDPSHGQVLVNLDGSYTYTPNHDYFGDDEFTVWVDDGNGGTAFSKVTIHISNINDAPIVPDYTKITNEDTTVAGIVVGSDVEGDSLSYALGTAPTHGTLTLVANGNWSYTPATNYHGPDQFTVIVSDGNLGFATSTIDLTVLPVNDLPTADDGLRVTLEDTAIDFSLAWFENLYTDIEDPNLVSIRIESLPAHGSLTLAGLAVGLNQVIPAAQLNGLKYTPSLNYHGDDLFNWKGFDGTAYSNLAKAEISITPVNDNPVVPNYNVTTDEDISVNGVVAATDVDGDTPNYLLDTAPSHGTVTVDGNGNWSYTPAANYYGPDQFTVLVRDGNGGTALSTINLTVQPVNDPPIILDSQRTTQEDTALSFTLIGFDNLYSDIETSNLVSVCLKSLPTHGSLSLNGSAVMLNQVIPAAQLDHLVYTPNLNYHGGDLFNWTGSDGTAASNLAKVEITITSVNDAPVVPDYHLTTAEDTAISDVIVATDADGDALSYGMETQPSNGTVVLQPNGSWTYTPNLNYCSSDSFAVRVSDGVGGFSISIVHISITPVNDPPVVPDYLYGIENGSFKQKIVASDIETPAVDLVYAVETLPTHGQLVLNANGSYIYVPLTDYEGTEVFQVRVTDQAGAFAISTVTLNISLNNAPPIAKNQTLQTPKNVALHGSAAATDGDGDRLSYAVILQPTSGQLVLAENGSWIYTPNHDFVGEDHFKIRVSDGLSGSMEITITVQVLDIAYTIDMRAIPSSLLGDGTTTTTLFAQVHDQNGNPVPNIAVVFSAPLGEFPNGTQSVTNALGIATVKYGKVDLSGTIVPKEIQVVGKVEDIIKNLYATDTISVYFMPATLNGIVIDSNRCTIVQNASVLVSKDFDQDGIIDFSATTLTAENGSYSVAVPYGNETYDVYITFDFEVAPGLQYPITFYQKGTVNGSITGVGQAFYSERIHYTVLAAENEAGQIYTIHDFSKLNFALFQYVSGSPIQYTLTANQDSARVKLLGLTAQQVSLQQLGSEVLLPVNYAIQLQEASGLFFIELPASAEGKDFKIVVYDLAGKEIGQESFRVLADGQFCVGSIILKASDVGVVVPQKDVGVQLSASQRSVEENKTVTFEITYINKNQLKIDQANLTLSIPDELEIIESDGGKFLARRWSGTWGVWPQIKPVS